MVARSFIISPLTDFGDQDEYVGVMKGVILSRAPNAVIVDLCHHIAPHDIRQAAAMAASAYRYFPEGTLHVMVVDPGVGSPRDIIWAQTRTQAFLCPDNGLLTEFVAKDLLQDARVVTNRDLFLEQTGTTFHGRDILAPVAGFLASGGRAKQLGPSRPIAELVRLADVAAGMGSGGGVFGTVVSVDRFGNVLTNIGPDLLTSRREGGLKSLSVTVAENRLEIPLVNTYSDMPPGHLVALFSSRNTLEFAINQGDAATWLDVAPGASISIALGD